MSWQHPLAGLVLKYNEMMWTQKKKKKIGSLQEQHHMKNTTNVWHFKAKCVLYQTAKHGLKGATPTELKWNNHTNKVWFISAELRCSDIILRVAIYNLGNKQQINKWFCLTENMKHG